MAETFQLICPECGLQYQLDVAMVGAKVKCTECGVKFIAHDDPPPIAQPVSSAPPPTAQPTSTLKPAPEPKPARQAVAEKAEPATSPQTPEDADSPVAQHVVKPTEPKKAPPVSQTAAPPKSVPKSGPVTEPTSETKSEPEQKQEPADDSPPPAKTPKPAKPSRNQRRSKKKTLANLRQAPDQEPETQPPPKKADEPAPQAAKSPEQKPPVQKTAPATSHPDAKHFVAVEKIAEAHRRILAEVGKVIVGQQDVIDQVLTAFFARGNCLLKGVPGLAKTLLVNTLADSMALQFHRIQFTPDLMPTDITGTNILEEDPATGKRIFTFRKGPVFTNLLLADEINRTPPKTQAALLEAMQEKQVTSGEKLYTLPNPFLVLATQNPIEQEGTYTLPEAQLDRFIFMVNVGYPDEDEELRILLETTRDSDAKVQHVLDAAAIIKIQEVVRSIPVTEHVAGYASRLVRATRPEDPSAPEFIKNWLHFGCGPRAGQSLLLAAKAHAALNGRVTVACDDIRAYALPTLRHRLVLNFAAAADGITPDDVIKKLLDTVKERTSS